MGRKPLGLSVRSSPRFIICTAFVATFTDGFLYGSVVPVLPFSLTNQLGVPEDEAQKWLSILMIAFGAMAIVGAPIAGWAAAKPAWRRTSWMLGLVLAFGSTLLFCLGKSIRVLVAARLLQGLSGPVIVTTGLAIVADQVNPDEIGSSIGFVLSGMNLGLLVSPFISGLVYERLGYSSVFAVVLGVIAVDFVLRVLMIEKEKPAKWINKESQDQAVENAYTRSPSAKGVRRGNVTEQYGHQPDANEETQLLPRANSGDAEQQQSWIRRKFPIAVRILSSKRLRAAFYGGFIHTVIITALDTTLPLFVKNTFGWNSESLGILFFSITIPSLLGPLVGWLSDRYGARKVTLFGFFLTVPSLGCMAVVRHNKLLEKVLLAGLLALLGTGLSFILSPLAADIFDEATAIADESNSENDKTGMFAQSFSIFSGALGVASVVGPGLPGLFYGKIGWPGVVGVLTAMVAAGGLQVFRHTGKRMLPARTASDA